MRVENNEFDWCNSAANNFSDNWKFHVDFSDRPFRCLKSSAGEALDEDLVVEDLPVIVRDRSCVLAFNLSKADGLQIWLASRFHSGKVEQASLSQGMASASASASICCIFAMPAQNPFVTRGLTSRVNHCQLFDPRDIS